ncbi:MAG: division/cell wall cluster transcriptional repressor MraZ [Armatimonadetes bacterium]|nr:division/cell wall cluster transcriptional repressor MraZ [Armatimonadota bacterium]
MFRGSFEHGLDDKGRFILPQKFRRELEEEKYFIISRGVGRCLFIFKVKEWESLESYLTSRSLFDMDALKLQRFLLGEAAEVQVDNQGRLAIPQPLRQYARIEKDVIIIGLGSRIEIWNKGRWEAMGAEFSDENLEASARAIGMAPNPTGSNVLSPLGSP